MFTFIACLLMMLTPSSASSMEEMRSIGDSPSAPLMMDAECLKVERRPHDSQVASRYLLESGAGEDARLGDLLRYLLESGAGEDARLGDLLRYLLESGAGEDARSLGVDGGRR